MITDIFARRYERALQFSQYHAETLLRPLFMQAAHIFFGDLQPVLRLPESFYRKVQDQLARELGLPALSFEQGSHLQVCAAYLAQPYELWNDSHGGADYFVKTRLSLLELLFREAENSVKKDVTTRQSAPRGLIASIVGGAINTPSGTEAQTAVIKAIEELNLRLRACGNELTYHNGLLQIASDELSTSQVAQPFWEIVAHPKWSIVDQDMKEACDRHDRAQPDSVTYATRALESVIKIISDENGWTTGTERGAVNYIENLQSERSGRFIALWEADALKAIFRHLRNPYSHGGGTNPPEPLSQAQHTWVIENCMSWIKSLVRRQKSRGP